MKSKNGEGQSRWILALASTTLVLCLTGGCSRPPEKTAVKSQPPDSKGKRSTNPALWAPPEAFDLQIWRQGVMDTQFRYRVRDRYPATKTIDGIKAYLRKGEWIALKENPFKPGTPSSLTRGWGLISHGQGPKKKQVRYWIADWQDKHGDSVRYVLQYATEAGKPEDLREVVVSGIYATAEDFKTAVRELAKMRAEDPALPAR